MASNVFPDVIVLNGPSSSGKTTIARCLQEKLPELFLNFSIDTILFQLPPSDLAQMITGGSIVRPGYRYDSLVRGYHAAAAGLLAAGNRLILDNAIIKDAWRADLQKHLQSYRAVWVGVSCGLPELVRRERERGDRAVGTAERETPLVHAGLSYDLMIDTTCKEPEQSAQTILRALHLS